MTASGVQPRPEPDSSLGINSATCCYAKFGRTYDSFSKRSTRSSCFSCFSYTNAEYRGAAERCGLRTMYLSSLFFFLLFAFESSSASIWWCSQSLDETKLVREISRTSSRIFSLRSCSFSSSVLGTTIVALGSGRSWTVSCLSGRCFAFFLCADRALALYRVRCISSSSEVAESKNVSRQEGWMGVV